MCVQPQQFIQTSVIYAALRAVAKGDIIAPVTKINALIFEDIFWGFVKAEQCGKLYWIIFSKLQDL